VRSARYGWAFTLVLCDLNNFKASTTPPVTPSVTTSCASSDWPALSVRQGDTGRAHRWRRVRRHPLQRRGQRVGRLHRPSAQPSRQSARADREFTIGIGASPRDSTDPAELFPHRRRPALREEGYEPLIMSPTEEDFELELRSLSGVLNVEIRHREKR
jgi:hypothetical protein